MHLEIRRKLRNDSDIIRVLIRIGPTLAKLGRHNEASATMNEAIELAKKRELPRVLGSCYSQLIVVHEEARQLKEARKAFDAALRLYEPIGLHLEIADASLDLGLAEAELGDSTRALLLLEDSVEIYRKFERKAKLAKALKLLGRLQRDLGLETAHMTFIECAQLFEDIDQPEEAGVVRAMLTN